ncbi:hypothetical protein RhiirC2_761640 [Rhizophagus irregularis]|uniref:Uncharacterized protein n=1 Tax=Rhizophagus irregularis TaxID=588596 RepID=A0A2N1MG25_9GLOM|nr:hypothetical protein RhiirC2_761640 [Rhizophagus irregularis]
MLTTKERIQTSYYSWAFEKNYRSNIKGNNRKVLKQRLMMMVDFEKKNQSHFNSKKTKREQK